MNGYWLTRFSTPAPPSLRSLVLFLKEDFHGVVRADWDTQLTGNALVPLKRHFHLRPLDIQRLRGTDTDAGGAVGTAILMPFDVLSQRLRLHPYLTQIF